MLVFPAYAMPGIIVGIILTKAYILIIDPDLICHCLPKNTLKQVSVSGFKFIIINKLGSKFSCFPVTFCIHIHLRSFNLENDFTGINILYFIYIGKGILFLIKSIDPLKYQVF